MSWSFPIGNLFGSELRVHATFFLLLAWIGLAAWSEEGPAAAAVNVLFILALFFCVVAHEFGHALMARRFGIRTPDITLLPIGGMARLERMPKDPVQEIWVAVAGPAVNIVIWAVLVLLLGLGPGLPALDETDLAGSNFFAQLAAINLMLVLFNMIPAFPMDGGRVFRALLSLKMGRARATAIAAGTGQAVAMGFALMGFLGGNLLLILIAIFIFFAATAESTDVQWRQIAEDAEARDAMITAFEAFAPDDGLAAMSASVLRTTQHEFPVVDAENRCLGIVTREAIFKASEEKSATKAEEAMTRGIPTVGLRTPLGEVLDAFGRDAASFVAVTGPDGVLLGYITRENLGEYMVLNRSRL